MILAKIKFIPVLPEKQIAISKINFALEFLGLPLIPKNALDFEPYQKTAAKYFLIFLIASLCFTRL